MYNKAVYEKLGLKIPLTWKEFIANCEKAKKAGYTAVIQTYKDTWTSQLLVLGDHFNVEAESPGYSANYTANKAKVATTKAAFAGFAHLEEVNKKGFLNKDYKSATFNKGLEYLALGKEFTIQCCLQQSIQSCRIFQRMRTMLGYLLNQAPIQRKMD